ncbi:MAG: hypothetical protein LBB95_01285 [Mycoplasmataceae bacterium]|jgi:hypothetical protein|nr:hypothetical protein [Mycoplasmataceae bacterium]
MQKNSTYALQIAEHIKRLKLTLFVCEIGTNGLISNILTRTVNKSMIGSYVVNNLEMLKKIGISNTSDPHVLVFDSSKKCIANFSTDICVVSYISIDKLYISITIFNKQYTDEIDLKNISDFPTYCAVQTIAFFSNLLNTFI